MENDSVINRRQALNSTFLAGLALAFGILKTSTVSAQSGGLNLKSLKIPKRQRSPIVETVPSKIVPKDYALLLDQINKCNLPKINKIKTDSLGALDYDAFIIKRIESTSANVMVKNPDAFLSNTVEILLDQASNLLERGIRDRTEWDNLSTKLFYLQLEVNQFIEYDELHKQETAQGYYDQMVNEKVTALNIENLTKDKLEQLAKVFSNMFEARWTQTATDQVANTQGDIAQLSNIQNGVTIKGLVISNAQYQFAIQYTYNFIEKEGMRNALDQSKLRLKNIKSKVDWEIVNRDFRKMRTEIERKYEYFKLASFTAEDGVLNFCKRIEPLQLRFSNDFSEAVARLNVAAIGLKNIFGFTVPLPDRSDSVDYFDRCISWNRVAINFLISFGRRDQSFSMPISLKDLLLGNNENIWNKFLQTGNATFEIDESFFPACSHIRIKGISLFVNMKARSKRKLDQACNFDGLVKGELIPPTNSYYTHDNGTKVEVLQSLPTLIFNRISTRSFVRSPEVAGTSMYVNISPFGKWTLRFPQLLESKFTDIVEITDIYLDLFVTVHRTVTKGSNSA